MGFPQRRHWLSPIVPIRVGSSLFGRYLLTIEGKARANLAIDDFTLQVVMLIWYTLSLPYGSQWFAIASAVVR